MVLDLDMWKWWIEDEKISSYYHGMKKILEADEVMVAEVKSVVGKIIWISPLWRPGRFHLNYLLKLANRSENLAEMVKVGEEERGQLRWWMLAVRFFKRGLPIPPTMGVRLSACGALVADSDAAGGSSRNDRKGVGAVLGSAYVKVTWSAKVGSLQKAPCCSVAW